LTSLQTLKLNTNQLTLVAAGSLRGLTSLRFLNAMENTIPAIDPAELASSTMLATIDVRGNNLTTFEFLQSPTLAGLGVSTSVVNIYPQRNEVACIAKFGCTGIADVCASNATCKSTFGSASPCCASSRGVCRTCTGNPLVSAVPVCVQCEECSIDDWVTESTVIPPPASPYFHVACLNDHPTAAPNTASNAAGVNQDGTCFTDGDGNCAFSVLPNCILLYPDGCLTTGSSCLNRSRVFELLDYGPSICNAGTARHVRL
jgi:hypothetical protein